MISYGEDIIDFYDFEVPPTFFRDAYVVRKCNEWTEYDYCGMLYVFYKDGRKERYFPEALATKINAMSVFEVR